MRRWATRRILATTLAAAVSGWIVTGCAQFAVEPYAGIEEIRGPWRAEPLSIAPAIISAAELACEEARPILGDAGSGDRLMAIDARGGGTLTLIYVGPGNSSMDCQLVMDAQGNLSMSGGIVQGVPDLLVAPNDVVIVSAGGMMSPAGATSAYGQVGPGVTDVRLVFPSGPIVRASVGRGWFSAWWPTHEMGFLAQAFDSTGLKVGEVEQ